MKPVWSNKTKHTQVSEFRWLSAFMSKSLSGMGCEIKGDQMITIR